MILLHALHRIYTVIQTVHLTLYVQCQVVIIKGMNTDADTVNNINNELKCTTYGSISVLSEVYVMYVCTCMYLHFM